MADKWEQLKDSVNQMYDSLDKAQERALEEARKDTLAEIESAKNDSVLEELRKITGRLDKIEARLPEEEAE